MKKQLLLIVFLSALILSSCFARKEKYPCCAQIETEISVSKYFDQLSVGGLNSDTIFAIGTEVFTVSLENVGTGIAYDIDIEIIRKMKNGHIYSTFHYVGDIYPANIKWVKKSFKFDNPNEFSTYDVIAYWYDTED